MTEARIKSADDLLVAVEREQLGKIAIPPMQPAQIETPEDTPEISHDLKDKEDSEQIKPQTETSQEKQKETKTSDDSLQESDTDEYGNTIAKERVYTQDEVNKMIRERLARGKQQTEQAAEPSLQSQPQQSDEREEWEQQLDSKIDQRVDKREQAKQEADWRIQQQATQAAYEEKFSQGMGKYNDFESVVTGKPITASMMMATKAMQDPAAFVYAACKNAPDELNRIAKIADPHIQIAEMARLEERMKKPRVTTNAPKPSRKISGDASTEMPKHSIDSLIASHAREKIIHTRRLK